MNCVKSIRTKEYIIDQKFYTEHIEYAAYGLVIEYVIACDLKIKMQMCRRHQKSKNNTTLVQD